MAKKLACHFRAVKVDKKDKEGNPTSFAAVRLRPGDDPSELPQSVQDDLEKQGLIVDERRLSKDGLVRIPYGEPDREPTSVTEPMVTESRPDPMDHPNKGDNNEGKDK